MSPADVLEYAGMAVGFPIRPTQTVIMKEECQGICLDDNAGHTSEKGAKAIVESISMRPNPAQLTIEVSILINEALGMYIHESFDESGLFPYFPFEQTQEDFELQRAEEARIKEEKEAAAAAKKAADEAAEAERKAAAATVAPVEETPRGNYNDLVKTPALDAPEADWVFYRERAAQERAREEARLLRTNSEARLRAANLRAHLDGLAAGRAAIARQTPSVQPPDLPAMGASDEEWEMYLNWVRA